jgi:hypothetical protein
MGARTARTRFLESFIQLYLYSGPLRLYGYPSERSSEGKQDCLLLSQDKVRTIVLFAPEVVLYSAWVQFRDATEFYGQIEGLRKASRSDNNVCFIYLVRSEWWPLMKIRL